MPLLLAAATIFAAAVSSSAANTANAIEDAVIAAREHGSATVAGQRVASPDGVATFYEQRELAPAWDSDNAAALVHAIDRAGDDGLDPADYHRASLDNIGEISPEQDVLLTDAFLTLADHFLRGRVHPESLIANWCIPPRRFDLPFVLDSALETKSVDSVVRTLAPPQEAYQRLRRALAEYREMSDWPLVDAGPTLCRGDRGPRVAQLRRRLGATDGDDFDAELDSLLRDFQRHHGLNPDGVAGADTIAELNVTRQQRIEQLVLNLERWRWMPRALPSRYLIVNIAAFQLEGFDSGRPSITMRTAVGKHYTKTPFLRSEVTKIVFNPFWNVPPSIATKELYPKQQSNAAYFASEHIDVLPGGQLRQQPGPWNALGRVKFDMPNPYAVYLHDTPSKSVFGKDARAVSHGCIRVEQPAALAAWLLEGRMAPPAIAKAIASGRNEHVPLAGPVRVYVLYWTAFVGDDGDVQFRRDVYERDTELAAALHHAVRP
ncbi:MAG TPA: L,D-transpeptidase family protein [Thermoanaerobaculia bacterium]